MKKLKKNDLKDLIHKSGHTLKSFCEAYNLSLGSVKSWNTLVRNPSYGSAVKICSALEAEGIKCTPELLMGRPSYILRDLSKEPEPYGDNQLATINDVSDFKKNNKDSVLLLVWDEKMAPYFVEGDHVGGTKLKPEDFPKAHRKICILKEKNKEKVIRNITYKDGDFYSYYAKRPSQIKLGEIDFIAPIIFVRKKDPFNVR